MPSEHTQQETPTAKSPGGPSTDPKQLRRRRARILKDKMSEKRQLDEIQRLTEKTNQQRSRYLTKLYIVVFTAFVVTFMAVTNATRPAFLYKRRPKQSPMNLATKYPPGILLERDLPRFYRSLTIATQKNKFARKAQIQIINSRNALSHGTGNLPVTLKGWDDTSVNMILEQDVCGLDYEDAYKIGSVERQNDLIMWCLMFTKVYEGYFQESVEMINNAFITARKRGMVVRRQRETGPGLPDAADNAFTMSNAYYLHPRIPDVDFHDVTMLPTRVLKWLYMHPESTLSNPKLALQDFIYKQIMKENVRDNYMILDEVCQETQPKRAIGQQCPPSGECCYFVVPEAEGGRFDSSDDEEGGDEASHRQLLRAGLIDEDNSVEESDR